MPAEKNLALSHLYALLVGFNFDGAPTNPKLPPLKGMVNDVVAAWRLLLGVGLWPEHAILVTDQPTADLEARLKAEGLWRQGLTLKTNEQLDDAVMSMKRLIDRGEADTPRVATRLLLSWSGHGGVLDKDAQGFAAPAVFPPNGEPCRLLDLLDGLLLPFAGRPTDAPPPIVAFFNACHTANWVKVGRRGDRPVSFDELGVAAFGASTPEAIASEVQIDGHWRTVMSWATTSLLSRFEVDETGGLKLSYAQLYHRMLTLLGAIDVKDEPLMFIPMGETNLAILRGRADLRLDPKQPKPGHGVEIYPTNPFHARKYDIDAGGKPVGVFVATGPAGGKTRDPSCSTENYQFDSYAFHGFGTNSTFTIDPNGVTPTDVDMTQPMPTGWPDLTGTTVHKQPAWKNNAGTSAAYTHVISDGTNTIYMDLAGTTLRFYANTTNQPSLFAGNAKLTFTYNKHGKSLASYTWIAS
ncbi:MAG: hypothetical protein KC620_22390 [Myxococcales bacterium]|nr:hypothetical protein [Myxococcales bacterium]